MSASLLACLSSLLSSAPLLTIRFTLGTKLDNAETADHREILVPALRPLLSRGILTLQFKAQLKTYLHLAVGVHAWEPYKT